MMMPAILTIPVFLVCYTLLMFQFKLANSKRAYDVKASLINTGSLAPVIKRNINGLIIFSAGIIIFLFMPYTFTFFQWTWTNTSILFTFLLSGLCITISLLSGVKNAQPYPGISLKQTSVYFFSRIPFLFAYEIFFRVILFQVCLSVFSVPVSFAINFVLYVLLHIYSSRNEFIGSMPFGLVLCYITFLYQSVYPAIILHLSVSLPFELLVLSRWGEKTKNVFV